jgi:hypothetical protein
MHENSNAHPFIHSSSSYFNRVCAKQCIHDQFSRYLTRPASDDHPAAVAHTAPPPVASGESEAWVRGAMRPKLSKQWSSSLSDEQLWAHFLFIHATERAAASIMTADDLSALSSSPLVLEYEGVADRMLADLAVGAGDISDILDYLCSVAIHRPIFFLWRPNLTDEGDNHLIELGVAGMAGSVVTQNTRDFRDGELRFPQMRIESPAEFVKRWRKNHGNNDDSDS